MPVTTSAVRLKDAQNATARARRSAMYGWARSIVRSLADSAADIAEDPSAAAAAEASANLVADMAAYSPQAVATLPFRFGKVEPLAPVLPTSAPRRQARRRQRAAPPPAAPPPPPEHRPGAVVEAFYEADYLWYAAVVLAAEAGDGDGDGDKVRVEYVGYDQRVAVPRAWLRPPSDAAVAAAAAFAGPSPAPRPVAEAPAAPASQEVAARPSSPASPVSPPPAPPDATKPAPPAAAAASSPPARPRPAIDLIGDERNPLAGTVHEKYWAQRHRLFSLYDHGIELDAEGWYSATPEAIGAHLAERCRCGVVVDAMCGVGANAIQFALTCERVVAIDIDPTRLALARKNAAVYGVADRIEWVLGDAFAILPRLRADVVFLSPPWGGPSVGSGPFDAATGLEVCGMNGTELIALARRAAPSVAYFLPRGTTLASVAGIADAVFPGEPCELEDNELNGKLKTRTAYFGPIAARTAAAAAAGADVRGGAGEAASEVPEAAAPAESASAESASAAVAPASRAPAVPEPPAAACQAVPTAPATPEAARAVPEPPAAACQAVPAAPATPEPEPEPEPVPARAVPGAASPASPATTRRRASPRPRWSRHWDQLIERRWGGGQSPGKSRSPRASSS